MRASPQEPSACLTVFAKSLSELKLLLSSTHAIEKLIETKAVPTTRTQQQIGGFLCGLKVH